MTHNRSTVFNSTGKTMRQEMLIPFLRIGSLLLVSGCLPALAAGDVDSGRQPLVPVKAIASSNSSDGAGAQLGFHVDKLLLGAKHFDPRTGGNAPYGLMGYRQHVLSCVAATSGVAAPAADHPVHEWYQDHPAAHPKHHGMWLTAKGDCQQAWLEFELPAETELGQIWIWNWADGPEIDRRAKQLSIQTSSRTTAAGQLGDVDYDVTHKRFKLPNIGHVQTRSPDLVYRFPRGTRSRYIRLHAIEHFGVDPRGQVGLAEVLVF
ncbi:MAG: hypothetical protein ABGZ17_04675, partial [Planctomycetaceae bacterium]